MEIIRNLEEVKKINRPLAIALGNFDGVHKGHQQLIGRCVEESKKHGLIPCVLTFDPHPNLILGNKKVRLLNTSKQKFRMIEKLGAEYLFLISFDKSFADTSPESFIEDYLVKVFNVKKIYVGFNYTFGHKGLGNPALLDSMGKRYGFDVSVIEPVIINKQIVSSTLIRLKYEEGDIAAVRELLGDWPILEGEVIPGYKRGRDMGFPTANLNIPDHILLPADGVYAAFTEYMNKVYQGVVNIGAKPTFNDFRPSVEINIFDFADQIYSEALMVHLVKRIRPVKKFTDITDLKEQIHKDSQQARVILTDILA